MVTRVTNDSGFQLISSTQWLTVLFGTPYLQSIYLWVTCPFETLPCQYAELAHGLYSSPVSSGREALHLSSCAQLFSVSNRPCKKQQFWEMTFHDSWKIVCKMSWDLCGATKKFCFHYCTLKFYCVVQFQLSRTKPFEVVFPFVVVSQQKACKMQCFVITAGLGWCHVLIKIGEFVKQTSRKYSWWGNGVLIPRFFS